MVPGWDGRDRVACVQGFPARTQQQLENHHSGTRVGRALESPGLPHMTTVAERGAGPCSHCHRETGRPTWDKHPGLLALF